MTMIRMTGYLNYNMSRGKRVFKDLTNQRFGMLRVVERGDDYICGNGKHKVRWICECDCGNRTLVRTTFLTSGHTKSCGCGRKFTNKNLKKNKG